MSRFQSWMAAWACLGMLIGPARECRAAEPAASGETGAKTATGAAHLDLAFIPADAVSAIVVHPQSFLTGPESDWLPVEVITAAGMKEAGFDPLKVREGIALFAPPARGPEPDIGFIVRFSESYSKEAVKATMHGRETKINGQEVIEVPGPQSFLWTFPDDKTLVGGTEGMLKKMFTVKDADSPLLGLLKNVDVSGQVTAVFSIDAVRPIMQRAIAAAPPVPLPFRDLTKVPDLLSAIILRVNAGEKFNASLTLRARDDNSAVETERIVNEVLTFGRTMVLAEVATMPRPANDPVASAGAKYLARITEKMFSLIKPIRDARDVSVTVETGSGMTVVPVLIALLLPAVQAARSAAERNTTMNKMRQIGLAMMNFESVKRRLPAHAIFSKDGKPLLSWRVAILPFLEEKALFDQFHLDEPWDSDHNKPLIDKMPEIYVKPGRPNDGTTVFLVPVGKGLAFEGTKELRLADFTDGTSKTILAVEVNDDRAVPWTKPDDLEVDLSKPFDGLGEAEVGGLSILLFADGHTLGITKQADEATVKALFTRNGGEPIDDSLIR
jgi:Protein of unknown function (DUF1559)